MMPRRRALPAPPALSTLLVAMLAACSPLLGQDGAPRPMSRADIMALRQVGSPTLSPDGRLVAYTVTGWRHPDARGDSLLGERHERRTHVWIVPTTGGTARQLTYGDRGERSPDWSPTGEELAFIAARGTGSEVTSQIWLLPMAGGEARPLTAARRGVESFSWSPDGRSIAYVSPDTVTLEAAARQRRRDDAKVYEEGFRMSHVWVIDVATREAVEVGHGDFTVRGPPTWSPDGSRLAFMTHATPMIRDLRGGVWIARADGSSLEQVAHAVRPYHALLSQPAWSPDGRTIAYTTMPATDRIAADGLIDPELDQRHLVLHDVASGQAREIRDPSFDHDISTVQWTPDSKRLLFVTGERAYHAVFEYDVRADRFDRIAGALLIGGVSWNRDMSRAAFVSASATAPGEIHVSDARFASPVRLTDTNPWVRDRSLGETEVITWRSTDGLAVEGILLKPVGHRPGTRVPLLVEAHGGPTGVTTSGFMASPSSPGQYWAGQGWAVLYPNPRGSTNYGRDFMRGNLLDWGGGDYDDVMAGVDAVVDRGIGDPDRLAIIGWSYGGYMAAWAVTQTDRFRAARMGAGMSDMQGMYLTTDIPGYIGLFFDGWPSDATHQLYRARSPVTHAHNVSTPVLILHGAGDDRVPTGQALSFFRALRNVGATVELVFYPRAGHGLNEYYHQLDRMRRDYEWISRHTTGHPR